MTLGSDVSRLSTTAASAAAQGLSIVVPLYNEAAGLALLHERLIDLARTLKARYGLASEVVYVDDGSADNTLAIARTLGADALDIQVVSLSRNFGKEAALMAGLDHARRGAILFMDGDGQHPPDLVEKLVSHWIDDGYDVVYTAKAHRDNESFLRRSSDSFVKWIFSGDISCHFSSCLLHKLCLRLFDFPAHDRFPCFQVRPRFGVSKHSHSSATVSTNSSKDGWFTLLESSRGADLL